MEISKLNSELIASKDLSSLLDLEKVRETGKFSSWEEYKALTNLILPKSESKWIWGVGDTKEIMVDRSGTIAFDGTIEVQGDTVLIHPDQSDSDPQTIWLACRKLIFSGSTFAIQSIGELQVHVTEDVSGDIVFECTNGLREKQTARNGIQGVAGKDQTRTATKGDNGRHAELGSHGSLPGTKGSDGAHGGNAVFDYDKIDGVDGETGNKGRDITVFAKGAQGFAILSLLSPGGDGQDGGQGAKGVRGGNGQAAGTGGDGGGGTPFQSASRGGPGGKGGNGGPGSPGGNGGDAGDGGDSGNLTYYYDVPIPADPQNDPGVSGRYGRGKRGGRGGEGGRGGTGGKGGKGMLFGSDYPNGGKGKDGTDGPDGRDGVDGAPGRDGIRGERAIFQRKKVDPNTAVRHLISFGGEEFVREVSNILGVKFVGPVLELDDGEE